MRTYIPVVALCGTLACLSASGDSGIRTAARDSSGVHIVENRGDGAAPWRIAPEPSVSIGGLDGDPRYELFNVQNAFRTVLGTIVVANQGSFEVRFYDSTGLHIRSVGREGNGPGEYSSLRWVHPLGNSLVAFDSRSLRLTFYTLTGDLVGTDRIRPTDDVPYPWPLGVFDDGTLLVVGPWKELPQGRGIWRDERRLYRYDPSTQSTSQLALERHQVHFREKFGAGGILPIPVLFGVTQEIRVHGNLLFEISSDEFQIRIHDSAGRLQTVIRKHYERQPISNVELEIAKEKLYTRSRHEAIRIAVRASFADMPVPSLAPALGLRAWERVPSDWAPKLSVIIDDVGNMWVLEFNRLAVDADRWTVFSPDGELIGTLEFPPGFQPFHIGDDFILGLMRDENDVEFVRLYDLRKEVAG